MAITNVTVSVTAPSTPSLVKRINLVRDCAYLTPGSEPTTNLVANGGFETNTTGWTLAAGTGSSLTRITTDAKYGSACASVVIGGTLVQEGIELASFALSSTTTYAFSAWVKGLSGQSLRIYVNERNGATPLISNVGPSMAMDGTWKRLTYVVTTQATTTNANVYVAIVGQALYSYLVDGVQIEQKAYATAYVETNGASASRTGTSGLTISRLVRLVRAIASTSSLLAIKQLGLIRALTEGSAPTLTKQPMLVRSATVASSATIGKAISLVRATTASSTPTLQKLATLSRVAAAASAPTIAKQAQLSRAAFATSAPTIAKIVNWSRSLTAGSAATTAKMIDKIASVGAASTTGIGKIIAQGITATAGTFAANPGKLITQGIRVAVPTAAVISKQIGVSLVATATNTARTTKVVALSVRASVGSVLSWLRQFIPHIPGRLTISDAPQSRVTISDSAYARATISDEAE